MKIHQVYIDPFILLIETVSLGKLLPGVKSGVAKTELVTNMSLRRELRIRKSVPCRLFADQWPLLPMTKHKYVFTGHHNWHVATTRGKMQVPNPIIYEEEESERTKAIEVIKGRKVKSRYSGNGEGVEVNREESSKVAGWKQGEKEQGEPWVEDGKGNWKKRFQSPKGSKTSKEKGSSVLKCSVNQLAQLEGSKVALHKAVDGQLQQLKSIGQEDSEVLQAGNSASSASNVEHDNGSFRTAYQPYAPLEISDTSSPICSHLELDECNDDNDSFSSSFSDLDDSFPSAAPPRPLSRSGPSWVNHYKSLNEKRLNQLTCNTEELIRALASSSRRSHSVNHSFNYHTVFCGHIRRAFYSTASSKSLLTYMYSRPSFVRSQLYKQQRPCNCSKYRSVSWYSAVY